MLLADRSITVSPDEQLFVGSVAFKLIQCSIANWRRSLVSFQKQLGYFLGVELRRLILDAVANDQSSINAISLPISSVEYVLNIHLLNSVGFGVTFELKLNIPLVSDADSSPTSSAQINQVWLRLDVANESSNRLASRVC